jgi:hypothetical protein
MRKLSKWAPVAAATFLVTCTPKLLLLHYYFLYLWGGKH